MLEMLGYDKALLMFINGFAGHWVWLDEAMIFVSRYGPLLFAACLAGMWFSGDTAEATEQNRRQALYAFAAALLALGINQLVGGVWFRDRPYVHNRVHRLLPMTPDASFPSDHAAGAFAIAGSAARGRPISGGLLAALAVIVAISRVYVGLHYPSDVLGGMLIGLISSRIVERKRALLERPVTWLLAMWNAIEAKIAVLPPSR